MYLLGPCLVRLVTSVQQRRRRASVPALMRRMPGLLAKLPSILRHTYKFVADAAAAAAAKLRCTIDISAAVANCCILSTSHPRDYAVRFAGPCFTNSAAHTAIHIFLASTTLLAIAQGNRRGNRRSRAAAEFVDPDHSGQRRHRHHDLLSRSGRLFPKALYEPRTGERADQMCSTDWVDSADWR